jgi:hypothetical protein
VLRFFTEGTRLWVSEQLVLSFGRLLLRADSCVDLCRYSSGIDFKLLYILGGFIFMFVRCSIKYL